LSRIRSTGDPSACTDAGPNADVYADGDPDPYGDAVRGWTWHHEPTKDLRTHPYPVVPTDADTDTFADRDTDPDAHRHTIADAHRDSDADRHVHTYSHAHRDGNLHAYAGDTNRHSYPHIDANPGGNGAGGYIDLDG
jgi:hypothetical protein